MKVDAAASQAKSCGLGTASVKHDIASSKKLWRLPWAHIITSAAKARCVQLQVLGPANPRANISSQGKAMQGGTWIPLNVPRDDSSTDSWICWVTARSKVQSPHLIITALQRRDQETGSRGVQSDDTKLLGAANWQMLIAGEGRKERAGFGRKGLRAAGFGALVLKQQRPPCVMMTKTAL